tara:strand:+ start:126 stop:362 length:237 start_codon:yes stop_codon:yes gene_type:complete
MDRELIEMDIKEAVVKIVDTLENYNPDTWNPNGFIDSRIHTVVQEAIVVAIHNVADDLKYKFKLGHYENKHEADTDEK